MSKNKKEKIVLLGKPKNKVMQYVIVEIINKNIKLKINDKVFNSKLDPIGKIKDVIGNVNKPYAVIKPIDIENFDFIQPIFISHKAVGERQRHYRSR
ncbi:MAG: hypothetical protein ACP5I6_04320 [Caldisphaera sp.]